MSATDNAPVSASQRISILQETITRCQQRAKFIESALRNSAEAEDSLMSDEITTEQVHALRLSQASAALVQDLQDISTYYEMQMQALGTAPEVIENLPGQSPIAATPSPAPMPVVSAPIPAPAQPRRVPLRAPVATQEQQEKNAQSRKALLEIAAQQAEAVSQAREKSLQQQEALRQRVAQQRSEREQAEAASAAEAAEQVQQAQRAAVARTAPALPAPVAPTPAPSRTPTAKARVLAAYERLMSPEHSPLTHMFAPAPWFEHGKGVITVGSAEMGKWHEKHEVDVQDFAKTVSLPTGFYGNRDGLPTYVVLRMTTSILVWNFGFGESDVHIFHSVMNPTPEDNTFRPVHACATSAIRRVLEEIGNIYGIKPSAMVLE